MDFVLRTIVLLRIEFMPFYRLPANVFDAQTLHSERKRAHRALTACRDFIVENSFLSNGKYVVGSNVCLYVYVCSVPAQLKHTRRWHGGRKQ